MIDAVTTHRSIDDRPTLLSSKITERHLQLGAALYVRQSTSAQLREHQESTAREYAMKDCLIAFGWPKQLIETTIEKQKVQSEQLILHSDRGPSMTSHSVAQRLGSLGVTKSHSRPHVSNDNPFSESQFKTMKYRPEFPKRFGCYEDALGFCRQFFDWYNNEHYHSGIGLLTPSSLHYGQADEIIAAREKSLHIAWQNNPERFVGGIPKPVSLPKAVWINAPKREREKKNEAPEANCPGAPEVTSLTHPRSGYPSMGCVSAEPMSVSPDNSTIDQENTLNTRAMPKKISGVRGLAPDQCGISN